MPFLLIPPTLSHANALAQLSLRAFATHPRMPIMWPRGATPELIAFTEANIRDDLRANDTTTTTTTTSSRNLIAIEAADPALPTPAERARVLGAAEFTFALDPMANARIPPPEVGTPPPENWPPGGNWEMRAWFKRNLWELVRKYFDGRGYILVDRLAVDPAYQGRKLGTQLLNWGIAEADAAGVAMCLEATAEGMPLYLKSGFRVAEDVAPDLREFGWTEPYDPAQMRRVWMVREVGGR